MPVLRPNFDTDSDEDCLTSIPHPRPAFHLPPSPSTSLCALCVLFWLHLLLSISSRSPCSSCEIDRRQAWEGRSRPKKGGTPVFPQRFSRNGDTIGLPAGFLSPPSRQEVPPPRVKEMHCRPDGRGGKDPREGIHRPAHNLRRQLSRCQGAGFDERPKGENPRKPLDSDSRQAGETRSLLSRRAHKKSTRVRNQRIPSFAIRGKLRHRAPEVDGAVDKVDDRRPVEGIDPPAEQAPIPDQPATGAESRRMWNPLRGRTTHVLGLIFHAFQRHRLASIILHYVLILIDPFSGSGALAHGLPPPSGDRYIRSLEFLGGRFRQIWYPTAISEMKDCR